MLRNNQTPEVNSGWKQQAYIVGGVMGTVFGLISAYLYVRSADDPDLIVRERSRRITNGQLFALFLALIPLLRVISDLGREPSDDKKK